MPLLRQAIDDTFEGNIVIIVTTGLKLQVVTVEVGNTRQNSLSVLLFGVLSCLFFMWTSRLYFFCDLKSHVSQLKAFFLGFKCWTGFLSGLFSSMMKPCVHVYSISPWGLGDISSHDDADYFYQSNLCHSICTAFVELLCEYPCVASGTAFEKMFSRRYHICTDPDFLHGIW